MLLYPIFEYQNCIAVAILVPMKDAFWMYNLCTTPSTKIWVNCLLESHFLLTIVAIFYVYYPVFMTLHTIFEYQICIAAAILKPQKDTILNKKNGNNTFNKRM